MQSEYPTRFVCVLDSVVHHSNTGDMRCVCPSDGKCLGPGVFVDFSFLRLYVHTFYF